MAVQAVQAVQAHRPSSVIQPHHQLLPAHPRHQQAVAHPRLPLAVTCHNSSQFFGQIVVCCSSMLAAVVDMSFPAPGSPLWSKPRAANARIVVLVTKALHNAQATLGMSISVVQGPTLDVVFQHFGSSVLHHKAPGLFVTSGQLALSDAIHCNKWFSWWW